MKTSDAWGLLLKAKMNNYFELTIEINPSIEDEIASICFERLGCEGVILAEEKYKDLEMVSTTCGVLKVFLTSDSITDYDEIKNILNSAREFMKSQGFTDSDLGSWATTFAEKENQDWAQKWKENWDITRISDRVVVVPSWIEYSSNPNEIVVFIDPEHAFGTGTHETTQLCVTALESVDINGLRVADIGIGSGILSIIAKKMGAEYVYGCDIDPEVIDVAIENANKNNVECVFETNTADKVEEKFDFVCANILHNVLAEIMGDLKNLLNDNGILALSGILEEKKDVVLEAIKKNDLNIIKTNHQNQWISFVVAKN